MHGDHDKCSVLLDLVSLAPVSETFKGVLSDVSKCAASGFGFLLASSSLLVGFKGSWYKQRAKEAGVYLSVVKYLFRAMWWCLALAVFSLAGLSYDSNWWKLPVHRFAVSLWLYLCAAALCATIRGLMIFSKLFLLIAEE